MLHFYYKKVDKLFFLPYNELIVRNFYTKVKLFKLRKIKELIIMNTREDYKPVVSCMALTIRKEHRLTVIKRATRTTLRISWKTLLYALFLTFANILV